MNFHRDGNINKILLLSVHSNTETVHAQTYCPFMYLYIVVCWWLLISLLMPAFTQLDHSIIAISGLLDFWMPLMFFGCCCYCCCCLSVSLLFVKIWWPKIVIQQFYDHNICVPNHAEPLPRSYRCDERDVIECILYIYVVQIWCDVIEVRPFFLHSIRKMQTLITLTSVQCDWCRCAIRIAGHAW